MFAVLLFSHCADDFLKEDFYSGANIETLVNTPSGLNNLVTACYVSSKIWYGKEYGWDLTANGTDLWTWGGDADVGKNMAIYNSSFNNQAPSRLGVVWAELYKAVNTCNTAIYYIPEADIDEELKQTRLAEVYFLRAFYYWHIVETWGNVHLANERITEPELELHRSPVNEFYELIFSDLDSAVKYLPESLDDFDYGRVHKDAALAMRARAHLTWASEYMGGNSFDGVAYSAIGTYNHKQQAIADAQAVIAGGYELYDNYRDIWSMSNNASANNNTENIWAINYSTSEYSILGVDPDEYVAMTSDITLDPKPFNEREGGNDGHMIFGMRWFNVYMTGTMMVRDDGDFNTKTEPTRPFCRYMPTKHFIDLFDADIDQRFYGTFNTVFKTNNFDSVNFFQFKRESYELGSGDDWNVPDELYRTRPIKYGDTCLVLYKDEVIPDDQYIEAGDGDWRYHITRNHFYVDMSMMYEEDGTIIESTTDKRRAYFDIMKWYDSTRVHNRNTNDPGSMRGQRDFIVFRLPEMYYIIAEASLETSPQAAYDALLTIADKRAVNGNGAAMLTAYGVNGAGDVDIDFILDDKAREMAGEHNRWFDLKRTGKLIERVSAYNLDAVGISEKHKVRPIPQVELDAVQNKSDFLSGPGIY